METPNNETLLSKLENLSDNIKDGFEGVHTRQDKTNGNVIKNTEHRIKVESALSIYKWLFGALGIGNIAILAKLFLGL